MLNALTRCTIHARPPRCTNGPPHRLLPRLINQYSSQPSQAVSLNDMAARRLKWLRMNQMVFSIGQLLKQVKNEEAVKFFESSISQIHPDDHTARFRAYDRGISVFLDHKRFEDALKLYKKMFAEERVQPSSGLWAKMLVCSSIVKAPHEQRGELSSLFNGLSRVLSFRSYSESK